MFGRRRRNVNGVGRFDIAPDEVFLDSSNLQHLDFTQMEGRVERRVSRLSIIAVGAFFALVLAVFVGQLIRLQIIRGPELAEASARNSLAHSLVFAERGVLYDRLGKELAWNERADVPYSLRVYADMPGLAHLVGYVRYPRADAAGVWWRENLAGVAGAEQSFENKTAGTNGKKIVEIDALGKIHREQIIEPAVNGESVVLSIDAELQSALFSQLSRHAEQNGFIGGASVIMDVGTGEILALTSFPEFDQQSLTDGREGAVFEYSNDKRSPFLNRAVSGLYTPGSIVKPILAVAALAEEIISPSKKIFSPGFISIPNPFNPDKPTIMRDWRANGWTDIREALAVSSDVYFYAIGGGYEDQAGLGIDLIDKYARRFGLGGKSGIDLAGEAFGVIPTPQWKAEIFQGEEWLLGDTYNTAIGQYGFQITPVQAARFAAAIANGGELLLPQLELGAPPQKGLVRVSGENLKIVREGMRLGVTSSLGTVRSLSIHGIEIAGKTGTAEVGSRNQFMNSWVIGFWPADDPKFAFAAVLERAPAGTPSGAAPAMRGFFEWLVENRPEYVK